jgi:CDP-diglyceride synthetase
VKEVWLILSIISVALFVVLKNVTPQIQIIQILSLICAIVAILSMFVFVISVFKREL